MPPIKLRISATVKINVKLLRVVSVLGLAISINENVRLTKKDMIYEFGVQMLRPPGIGSMVFCNNVFLHGSRRLF